MPTGNKYLTIENLQRLGFKLEKNTFFDLPSFIGYAQLSCGKYIVTLMQSPNSFIISKKEEWVVGRKYNGELDVRTVYPEILKDFTEQEVYEYLSSINLYYD